MHGIDAWIGFGARRVDLAIGAEILLVVEPLAVEAALMAEQQAVAQLDERRSALELERQQAEYEAKRAARRDTKTVIAALATAAADDDEIGIEIVSYFENEAPGLTGANDRCFGNVRSLVASCKLHDLDPERYLAEIILIRSVLTSRPVPRALSQVLARHAGTPLLQRTRAAARSHHRARAGPERAAGPRQNDPCPRTRACAPPHRLSIPHLRAALTTDPHRDLLGDLG